MMKIAVIGSGISGLSAAWMLDQQHQVTLYEAADYLGGHTNTVDITLDGVTHPVDTGFLVHNDLTYPNLIQLLKHIGVETYASDMSFSVQIPEVGIEWAGTDANTVFGQRRNLLRPRFWYMLKEILRFNAEANKLLLKAESRGSSLGALLDTEGYSRLLRDWYLLPMAAAIWSSTPREILDFPAATFLRFCINHRLLQTEDRPQWRSIVGGGRSYVKKLAANLNVRLNSPVDEVLRGQNEVTVCSKGESETYDAVIMATHAPDSLRMLGDASESETAILGAVGYQHNEAILHTDKSYLPHREMLWSAWNYLSLHDDDESVCVTYLLNQLQKLPFRSPVMVTLNPPADSMPSGEIARYQYAHPVFDQRAIDAQQQLPRIQGSNRTWFCGAWCGYGFHEDGLRSALQIIGDFDVEAPWPAVL
jgi:predicted NAD/FAD-binding protein